jgi:uncharacterized membrane protein
MVLAPAGRPTAPRSTRRRGLLDFNRGRTLRWAVVRTGVSIRPRARPAGWRPPRWRNPAEWTDPAAWRRLVERYGVHLPVAAAIVLYSFRFALLSVQVQDAYGAPGFDMGIFDQGAWLLSRFHAPFVTVMGRDLFGDHTSFALLLAVPFYWVWPEAQTLLVLQSFCLAAAAVPIYLLALRRLQRVTLATALAIAYLLNPALEHGNLEQYHPESFLVLFIAVAIYAALEWRPRLLVVASILCLLVKEDTALLIVPLALWVFWRRDRRVGVGLGLGAALYMAFAYEVVIRFLLGTTSFYSNRIPFGGLGGLASAPFLHAGRFWSYAKSGYRPFYVWQMGASFGWAFLIAPEVAAIGILTLAENTLSSFPYMQQILYHYSLPLVAVLAMGTVFALGHLATPRMRQVGTAYVLVAAVAACWLWGLAPFSRQPTYPHAAPDSPAVRAVNRALQAVPPNAVVSADYPYVSHLDHRLYCYQWPTPFRATYWDLYIQEGQTLPEAARVRYLVIPTDRTGVDQSTFAAVAHQFTLVTSGGGVSVYKRVAPPSPGAGP